MSLEDLDFKVHNRMWYDNIYNEIENIKPPVLMGKLFSYFGVRKEYLLMALEPSIHFRSAIFSGKLPVGAVSYRFETFYDDDQFLEITHLGSLISNIGIGTGLINHMKNVALDSGFDRIGVTPLSDAVVFYRKCGFGRESERKYTGTSRFYLDL